MPQTRWVSWEGPAETWGSWSSWAETSEHRGACDDWEIKETRTRTSNRCRTETQYQWVSWEGPAETWGSWSSWAETSETRGQCDDWEIKETRTRTSNRCRTQTQERWVTWEGPAETWGSWSSWSDTGSHRGSGMEREKEQERTRTSNRCRTQTEERWVADPESTPTPPVTETWGDWGRVDGHWDNARHGRVPREGTEPDENEQQEQHADADALGVGRVARQEVSEVRPPLGHNRSGGGLLLFRICCTKLSETAVQTHTSNRGFTAHSPTTPRARSARAFPPHPFRGRRRVWRGECSQRRRQGCPARTD